ncbi:hypothetical protein [Aquimarina rubra]|uniref:Outer membrane protein beta-barrel domain-containing protein n=1 Tax=Aquimarina rubra TaxID=1920033 RepID=A0ABW5LJ93_9FLAO
MRKIIKLIVLLLCVFRFGYGQDLGTTKKPFAFSLGVSTVLNETREDSDGFVGFWMERKNGWGYGVDVTQSSYRPSSLKGDLIISEIENFQGTVLPNDTRIQSRSAVRDNRLYSLSPNVFKSFSLNDKKSLKFYISAGPSIIYNEDYEYAPVYSPGTLFLFDIGPSVDYLRVKEDKRFILGGFSKMSLRYTFNKVVGLELSGYGNVNGVKSVLGVQFGVVLGRLF